MVENRELTGVINLNKKKLTSLVVSSLIVLTLCMVLFSVNTSAGEYDNLTFWFTSGQHIGASTWEPAIYPADLEDMYRLATNDTRDNISYDIHLVRALGDLTDTGTSGQYSDFYAIESIIEGYADECINTTGNHDGLPPSGWDAESGYNKASARTFGNVVIYSLNVDAMWSRDYDYDGQMEWLNTSLQANTSNICILSLEVPMYHAIYNYAGAYASYEATPADDFNWLLDNTNVEMYIFGDFHKNVDRYDVINVTGFGTGYGGRDATLLAYSGTTQRSSYSNWNTNVNSLFMLFEHGSDEVKLRWRNHTSASWATTNHDGGVHDADGTTDTYFTWNMSMAFDSGSPDPEVTPPHFTSINNQENDTSLFTSNRTFVFTLVENTTTYQLQVSNSSTFATTFIDLSNISEGSGLESMPGGGYSENATHVTFLLPYAYNISFYGSHYYRVRAYTT